MISSDSNNIIIYKYENNQFIKQSIIKISYQSYLQKIKDDEFCALISDDSLRFYKMKENEFIEDKKIKEIKTDFTILKNLELNKEEKNDNSIEKINIKKIALVNNDYLCVCGDKNNIYIIDLKKHEIEKIIILNPKSNFVSIINWINDSILILDQKGVLYFFNLFEEINTLYFYDVIPKYGESLLVFPFGIKRISFDQKLDSININNLEKYLIYGNHIDEILKKGFKNIIAFSIGSNIPINYTNYFFEKEKNIIEDEFEEDDDFGLDELFI